MGLELSSHWKLIGIFAVKVSATFQGNIIIITPILMA